MTRRPALIDRRRRSSLRLRPLGRRGQRDGDRRDPGDGPDLRKAVAAAMPADKKRVGRDILMAIPEAIGSVSIEAIPLAELQAFVMEAP